MVQLSFLIECIQLICLVRKHNIHYLRGLKIERSRRKNIIEKAKSSHNEQTLRERKKEEKLCNRHI